MEANTYIDHYNAVLEATRQLDPLTFSDAVNEAVSTHHARAKDIAKAILDHVPFDAADPGHLFEESDLKEYASETLDMIDRAELTADFLAELLNVEETPQGILSQLEKAMATQDFERLLKESIKLAEGYDLM